MLFFAAGSMLNLYFKKRLNDVFLGERKLNKFET